MAIKFMQTLHMHLNGGKKFNTSIFKVYADGVLTNISRTRGREGKELIDVFHCGSNELNARRVSSSVLIDWLTNQLAANLEEKPPTGNVSS